MPIQPSFVERVGLRLGVTPAPLVDFLQHAAFRTLLAGYRLGVFEALAVGPLTLDELAARVEAKPPSLEPLLDVLRRLGYLTRRGEAYANTATTARWLIASSPQTITPIVGFLEDFVGRWDHLEETVKEGRPPFTTYEFNDLHPDRWPLFHDGMRMLALFTIDEVARKARLPADRSLRLLDVGGSHGLYALALCRRYPRMEAVIYDWPAGVAAAQVEIARAGLGARVTTRTGDFLTDDLGHGYDVALLGNIIHGQKPPAIVDVLRRLRVALEPDGSVLILDQVAMRQPLTRFAGYAAALTGLLLLNELGGGIYPYTQVRSWLRETGYPDVRLRRLLRAPGNVLIQARRGGRGG